MGRGLSELQRSILRLALHNRKAEGLGPTVKPGSPEGMDVYKWEVLESAYGFGEHRKLDWKGRFAAEVRWTGSGFEAGRNVGFGQLYSRSAMGPGRYHAAHAAVSKAFRRLEARGLAEWPVFGLKLTAKGVEVAERLSVKIEEILPHP
jgi:hypothetical protein